MDRVFGGVYQSKNNNDLLSNNPVSAGSPSVGSLSPYLNIDPKTLAGSQESQYLDVEGEVNQRGSFERSFSLIGTSMCAGVGAQFIKQTYITLRTGRQNTNRSILISQVSKALARTGIKFGIASIRFSLLSVLFEKARGESDIMNGAIAGASVGLLEARKVAVSPKVKLPPLKLGGLVGGYAVVGLALGALLHDRFFTKHRANK